MFKLTILIWAVALATALTAPASAQNSNELEEIRKQIEALKDAYETRIQALEKRLKAAEDAAAAAKPAAAETQAAPQATDEPRRRTKREAALRCHRSIR